MADVRSKDQLNECGLPVTALEVAAEGSTDNSWSWVEVKHLSKCLVQALDAGLEHALLVRKFSKRDPTVLSIKVM
jgi:hypothetical protein